MNDYERDRRRLDLAYAASRCGDVGAGEVWCHCCFYISGVFVRLPLVESLGIQRRIIRYRPSLRYARVDSSSPPLVVGTFIVAFPHSYPPIPLSFRHSENEIFIQYHAKEHAFITRWRHQSSFSSEPAVIYSCLRSSR